MSLDLYAMVRSDPVLTILLEERGWHLDRGRLTYRQGQEPPEDERSEWWNRLGDLGLRMKREGTAWIVSRKPW